MMFKMYHYREFWTITEKLMTYNTNYAQFLSIMNIKGMDCTNQYFTLRKRICHGKWDDGKRIDCEGNHSHFANNTNMPRQSKKLVFYTRTTFFYMHLSWSMGITAPFFKRTLKNLCKKSSFLLRSHCSKVKMNGKK